MKKFELGRSMVEMLGVLAIIGVLSITGILGYKTAMSKYKANEAANGVSIAYIQMEAAALQGKQGEASIEVPTGTGSISLTGNTYPQAGINVDFGNDTLACKQFADLYENSSQYHVVAKCGE